MTHAYRRKRFRLREMLLASTPAYEDEEVRFYKAAEISGVDTEAITYFAISVFWRAAAHSWNLRGEDIEIDLGPYTESLRGFLLDEMPFPPMAALSVLVGIEDRVIEFATPPMSRNDNGFHVHIFSMPGVTFLLTVGARIPLDFRAGSFAPAKDHLIAIYPDVEREQINSLAIAIREARNRMSANSRAHI